VTRLIQLAERMRQEDQKPGAGGTPAATATVGTRAGGSAA